MGVTNWIKDLLKKNDNKSTNEQTNKEDEQLSTPIQQDASDEEGAEDIDTTLIPSAGSEVADIKQLEAAAKTYGKKGLDPKSTSENALKEYNSFKEDYLKVLNDGEIADSKKLIKLAAIVMVSGEKFKATAYDDKQPDKVLKEGDKLKGKLTIGYGFTDNVKIGDTMTEAEAAERLTPELESRVKTLAAAEKKHKLELNVNQRVALISAIYNGGWKPNKYKNSTKAIKGGRFEPLLANSLESSSQTHINGLLKRRLLEYLIFNVAPPVTKTADKKNLTAKANIQDTIVR